jgi:hypothetical protein
VSAARKLAQKARAKDVEAAKVVLPSQVWRGRILEFSRDWLGIRSLALHQRDVLEEYQRNDNAAILVCTGQKMGKTECIAIAALYDFATEALVKCWLYGPKIDHTEAVVWPRIALYAINGFYPCIRCMPAHRAWCKLIEVDPLDETPRPERCQQCTPLIPSELKDPKKPERGRVSDWLNPTDAEAGLRAPDGRSVRAYTGRKEGSKGGFSGKLRLFADECSDISKVDRETWAGNLVGGGKVMGFGNLLYPHGWFAEAFRENTKEAARWTKRIQKSSRYSPNCQGTIRWSDGVVTANDNAGPPIRGMATPEGIEKNLRAWAGTNYVCARIDAQPPKIVEGQLAGIELVATAERRWPANEPDGILQFGVDVARIRDKYIIAPRRGNSIRELIGEKLGDDDYSRAVDMLFDARAKYIRLHERKPRLVYDASGKEGQRFGQELRARKAEDHFEVYAVYSTFAPKNRKLYDKRRDELACHFAEWLKFGSIPSDTELEAEIEATVSKRVEVSYGSSGNRWEVQRVITNDELRPILGRSPDKRNACELAVWDVDGSEVVEAPAMPDATPTRPDAPQAKRAEPANDVFAFDIGAESSAWDRYNAASSFARGAR